MESSLISDVLEKAYTILSSSIDLEERRNAQSTIDNLIELLGKNEVGNRVREIDSYLTK